MATCITCGTEMHPERAEKYNYCTAPDCQEKNAKGLTMVALGQSKAADQYLLLDELVVNRAVAKGVSAATINPGRVPHGISMLIVITLQDDSDVAGIRTADGDRERARDGSPPADPLERAEVLDDEDLIF